MTTTTFPEVHARPLDDAQSLLPMMAEGVLRYVWTSKFGPMLIEVAGDKVFVNGELVERARP